MDTDRQPHLSPSMVNNPLTKLKKLQDSLRKAFGALLELPGQMA